MNADLFERLTPQQQEVFISKGHGFIDTAIGNLHLPKDQRGSLRDALKQATSTPETYKRNAAADHRMFKHRVITMPAVGAALGGAAAKKATENETDSKSLGRKAAVAGGLAAADAGVIGAINIGGNKASKARFIARGGDPKKYKHYICPTGGVAGLAGGALAAGALVAANKARQLDKAKKQVVEKNATSGVPKLVASKKAFLLPEAGFGVMEGAGAGAALGALAGAARDPKKTGKSRSESAGNAALKGAGAGALIMGGVRAKGSEAARKRMEEFHRTGKLPK